jgi:hypothetical protein
LIGEGSYGRVYYAILDSEKHVAVKKLDASTDPELDNEFLTQVWFYSYVHILPVVCPSILIKLLLLTVYSVLSFCVGIHCLKTKA